MNHEAAATLPDPWQEWFGDHAWKLMAFARQLVTTDADAEDLVQEVILEFWRTRPKQPPDLPLALFKLRQRAIDLGRRRQNQMRRETRWQREQTSTTVLSLRDPNVLVIAQPNEIQALVARLEPIFREVIVLKLWNGLTMQQIANVLSVSPNTAASRYRLAIQKLRVFLDETCHE